MHRFIVVVLLVLASFSAILHGTTVSAQQACGAERRISEIRRSLDPVATKRGFTLRSFSLATKPNPEITAPLDDELQGALKTVPGLTDDIKGIVVVDITVGAPVARPATVCACCPGEHHYVCCAESGCDPCAGAVAGVVGK
jgi:hypothetical protein